MSAAQNRVATDEIVARAGVYRFLARLWVREVDDIFLQKMQTSDLAEAFAEAGGVLPTQADVQSVEQLGMEYCRLFLGPSGHLPPFQSVWTSGQFQDDTTASMEKYIDLIGCNVCSADSGTMVDHFGIQLDVMGCLLNRLLHPELDSESSLAIPEISRQFFHDHLCWATPLIESVIQRASSEFYRSVAAMTESFLAGERKAVVTPSVFLG